MLPSRARPGRFNPRLLRPSMRPARGSRSSPNRNRREAAMDSHASVRPAQPPKQGDYPPAGRPLRWNRHQPSQADPHGANATTRARRPDARQATTPLERDQPSQADPAPRQRDHPSKARRRTPGDHPAETGTSPRNPTRTAPTQPARTSRPPARNAPSRRNPTRTANSPSRQQLNHRDAAADSPDTKPHGPQNRPRNRHQKPTHAHPTWSPAARPRTPQPTDGDASQRRRRPAETANHSSSRPLSCSIT